MKRIEPLFALLLLACSSAPATPPSVPAPVATTSATVVSSAAPKPALPSIPCSTKLDPALELALPELDHDANLPSARNARAWVDLLASPELRGRGAATADSKRAARMIARNFAAEGLEGTLPNGELCQYVEYAEGDQNVVARMRAKGQATDVVIVGAHYDHLGAQGDTYYPGADDNASGVAAMLEVARVLSKRGGLASRDVVFIAFGAEEAGIVGSRFFVTHPTIDLASVRRMYNLDMVGRPLLDGHPARLLLSHPDDAIGYIVSERGRAATDAAVAKAADAIGIRAIGIPESVMRTLGFASDSVPFSKYCPTVFFSTSIHSDYHQPSDTADKVVPEQIVRAARLVLEMLDS